MLYNFLLPYVNQLHIANLFHYITFRTGIAILLSLIFCFVMGPFIIAKLKRLQKNGQPIRDLIPEGHLMKQGTPTMGGFIIIFAVIFSNLILADLSNPYIWICIFVLIGYGFLGFLDDYSKISKNNHRGLSGKSKLLFQFLVGLIACFAIQKFAGDQHSTKLAFPFFKNLLIDLGYFYLPFAVFVIVGASNAVNLTDGLDGLATVPIAIAAASFGLISYLAGSSLYANYLQIIYVSQVGELTIFCGAIVGACLGFLWFNAQPADIWMGDTGSLSLGGVLGTISVITKHEIVLAIIGGVFVIETLSVIMQVYYFKITKRKKNI